MSTVRSLLVLSLAAVFSGSGARAAFYVDDPRWQVSVAALQVSAAIVRYRTVADRDTVSARTLLSSRTVPWTEIEGLRFTRSSWARARLRDGSEMTLPAVTFATLPLLTAASGGRVPNPYA